MNFVKFLNILLLAACFVLCVKVPECQSQLTFSPSWGKRASTATQSIFGDSSNVIPQTLPPQQGGCNPKMESMLYIYRLIQNEAQKIFECNQQK